MNPHARPEERAAQRTIEQSYLPKKVIGNVLSTATTLGGATALGTRIVPLLSKLVPSNIAVKGLQKISPRLGKFFSGIVSSGHTIDEGLDYLREKINPEEKENESQLPEELHTFVDGLIKNGRSLDEAGAIAQSQPKFRSSISQLEKQFKTPWSSILSSIFGSEQQPQQQSKSQNPTPDQPKQPQQNQGDSALLAALDKILKM